MAIDPKEFAEQQFKAAQRPLAWLLSAERLRDAAETILKYEVSAEIPFFQAYKIAQEEAVANAYSGSNDAGTAEIKALSPNYPPAQLIYAYAIENVLKGIIVSRRADLIQEKLAGELATHNLIKLAEKADFAVYTQEWPVLQALSNLSIWAGRYPVARTRREFADAPNPDELLNYGSDHPVMRMFFDRAHKELERLLPQPIGSRFGWVVVFRQPGT